MIGLQYKQKIFSCQAFCTPCVRIYLANLTALIVTRLGPQISFLFFRVLPKLHLICTFMHLSQPPVKNMLSSKGWNFKAKTFLPCPDSGAKMSSLLQKRAFIGVNAIIIEKIPMTQNRPFQICPWQMSLCTKPFIYKY